jgi:predicted nucleic acid-binding protein
MVGTDATTLSLMLHPTARPPKDPRTGKPIERLEDRIEKLLEDLDAENDRIIIPTPCLSEFLVLAGKDGPAYLDKIREMKTLLIRPFDEMAAIELAAIEYEDRSKGDKRGGVAAPWAKVKFDRQIVAVAKVNGAKRLYSDDEDVIKFGRKAGLDVISTWDLPLPVAKQTTMNFGAESAGTSDAPRKVTRKFRQVKTGGSRAIDPEQD